MDRELWMRHLAIAERHVAESEQHVLRQRALVERLAKAGRDVQTAEYLLEEFQRSLALHAADRDRIRADLLRPA